MELASQRLILKILPDRSFNLSGFRQLEAAQRLQQILGVTTLLGTTNLADFQQKVTQVSKGSQRIDLRPR